MDNEGAVRETGGRASQKAHAWMAGCGLCGALRAIATRSDALADLLTQAVEGRLAPPIRRISAACGRHLSTEPRTAGAARSLVHYKLRWLEALFTPDRCRRAAVRRAGAGAERQAGQARLPRVQVGNDGGSKSSGEGVFELRIDWGPGYRVYFSWVGRAVVLLLC